MPEARKPYRSNGLSIRAVRNHLDLLEQFWAPDQTGAKVGKRVRHDRPVQAQNRVGSELYPPEPDSAPLERGSAPPRNVVPHPPERGSYPEPLVITVSNEPNTPHTHALPHGIEQETWDGFLEVRRKRGKIPTEKAVQVIFKDLGKMKEEGEDVNAVLEQSIINEWVSVYRVKIDNRGGREKQRQPQRWCVKLVLC